MKFWQNWPYWLRGGVIGAAIPAISLFLMVSCTYTTQSYACFLLSIPLIPFYSLSNDLSVVLTGIMIWFILGSFIGALVGHIKSKKKISAK